MAIEQTVTPLVVYQTDFANVVGSSTGVEVEVTMTSDGSFRFHAPPPVISGDDWTGSLSGSGITTVQGLADWIDANVTV